MSARRVTYRLIGEKAGVHRTTVGLALKNHPRIPKATRDRIQAIADQLNYRPDPALAALAAYAKGMRSPNYVDTIVFLHKFKDRHWRKTPSYYDFFEGLKGHAEKLGYRAEEFWLNEPGMTGRRASEILFHRNVRGLIVAPIPVSRGHLRLDWSRFSSVTVGYSLLWPNLNRVCNHQYRSMLIALRRLHKMGYRRIGLAIRSSDNERADQNWLAGYLVGTNRWDKSIRIPPFLFDNFHPSKFRHWFDRFRPEVIITMATKIASELKLMNVRVPQEVLVVNLDCSNRDPDVIGIHQNWMKLGEVAVDMLITLLNRNETGIPKLPVTSLVDGEWYRGQNIVVPE